MFIKCIKIGDSLVSRQPATHRTFWSEDFRYADHTETGVDINLRGTWFTTTFDEWERIQPLLMPETAAAPAPALPDELVIAWRKYKRYEPRSKQWNAAFSDLAFVLSRLVDAQLLSEEQSLLDSNMPEEGAQS